MVVAHSMGGLIALDMMKRHQLKIPKLILVETNIKPAGVFYRNVMTKEHIELYGEQLQKIFQAERCYYSEALIQSFQQTFDASKEVLAYQGQLTTIYGDRANTTYYQRYQDLNLTDDVAAALHIRFIENCCHMPMIEEPKLFSKMVHDILYQDKNEYMTRYKKKRKVYSYIKGY